MYYLIDQPPIRKKYLRFNKKILIMLEVDRKQKKWVSEKKQTPFSINQ